MKVCEGARGCVRVCKGVQACKRVWEGVGRYGRVCEGARERVGGVRVCTFLSTSSADPTISTTSFILAEARRKPVSSSVKLRVFDFGLRACDFGFSI